MDVATAYANGRVRFMGVDLYVAPGALVPREETELLARTAIDLLKRDASNVAPKRVIDMCCGAGNLACAIACHVNDARVWASDLTRECADVTRRNAAELDLQDRIAICQGDLFEPLSSPELLGKVDMVVCNPPYISEKRLASDRAGLLELEPREAFAAGPYGLSVHMRVIREALPFLRPGGSLLMEVGLGQEQQVQTLFLRAKMYDSIAAVTNEQGEARVVIGRRVVAP